MPTPPLQIDENYLPYATERQRELIQAIIDHGGASAADRALGVFNGACWSAYRAAQKRAANRGYAPDNDMKHAVPDGYLVKGVSTYYGKDGQARGQWVKSKSDDDARERIARAAVEALAADVGRADPVAPPTACSTALLNQYTITDYHVGMLAWHKEGGADWDLAIAERTLAGCFSAMIEGAPRAETAIVVQLGDFLHFDGLSAITPTSGHQLDADSRFEKVVQFAVRMLRDVVDQALSRHARVHVIMAEGNHDIASSVWLRTIFAALYENEPRCTVEQSPLPYYAFRHGETMLGFHHGHLSKNDTLPSLFAEQFAGMWGATSKRYAHTGHRHHVEEKEHRGMSVIQHPTLAARDAYAARGGWHAMRAATAITYHDRYGRVATNSVTPEMIEPGAPTMELAA